MPNTLFVRFFGEFAMTYPGMEGPGHVVEKHSAAQRMWTFLEYLCAFRRRPVEQTEIIEVLNFLPRYRGDFLCSAAESDWAVSLRTYYHNIYLQLCHDAADYMGKRRRYAEAIDVCRRAATFDPYDERCQRLLMRLLHESGATQSALWHYSSVSKLFMDRLGAAPSQEMEELYHQIASARETKEMDLDVIRRQLQAENSFSGPLFCEYGVFQDIYRLMASSMTRFGYAAQLVLLTVEEPDGRHPSAERCAAAMDELRASALVHLRSGDVCTRLSSNQYMLLLTFTDHESAGTALSRCLASFEETSIGRTVAVQTGVLSLLPEGQEENKHD